MAFYRDNGEQRRGYLESNGPRKNEFSLLDAALALFALAVLFSGNPGPAFSGLDQDMSLGITTEALMFIAVCAGWVVFRGEPEEGSKSH